MGEPTKAEQAFIDHIRGIEAWTDPEHPEECRCATAVAFGMGPDLRLSVFCGNCAKRYNLQPGV